MKSTDMLRRATTTSDCGADFRAEKSSGFARLTPLHARAAAWLEANVSTESTWIGEALMVEMAYFPSIADAVIDAGFMFEREAYPN